MERPLVGAGKGPERRVGDNHSNYAKNYDKMDWSNYKKTNDETSKKVLSAKL